MIHEYAVEPELVATWVDRGRGRYFIEKFGLGQPRVVSRYPKSWKRLVWEAFGEGTELERKRLEELIARLSETTVKRRDGPWNPGFPWLANAEDEHRRVPFHAILARANPSSLDHVLAADELDDGASLWAMPHGRTVSRKAVHMATAVASMLRAAEEVVFVDPHFNPEERRWRGPLREFLRAVVDGRPGAAIKRIEIHCAADGKATEAFFRSACERRLPNCIPRNLRIAMVRLRQQTGGEHLHNRYIPTNLGGVMFGVGLDEGDDGDSDDISLLDRSQYEERWRQYAGGAPAFDRPEPVVIIEGAG